MNKVLAGIDSLLKLELFLTQPMFEHRSSPLLNRKEFHRRLFKFVAAGAAIIAFSLSLGTIGYHYIADLRWIDALLDASMILAGMGPVSVLTTDEAKLFASVYALFSGIAFLSSVGLFIAPVAHRFFHKFHLDLDD